MTRPTTDLTTACPMPGGDSDTHFLRGDCQTQFVHWGCQLPMLSLQLRPASLAGGAQLVQPGSRCPYRNRVAHSGPIDSLRSVETDACDDCRE